MCLMSYANNKGAGQPAHPRSLISAFVVRCLDSIISLDFIAENSRLQLASVAAQAGLCLAWSETPEDTFSHGEAHVYMIILVTSRFILIWCYLFVVGGGVGKSGMSGTLPSYEVLSQRNVTMFTGYDFLCLYT